jgi:hypothetical protein
MLRAVACSKHKAELTMIKHQLEFDVEADRSEYNRT